MCAWEPPRRLCLASMGNTDISPGSTILPRITASPSSDTHTHDRVPLVSPLREVDRILQHSKAVTQESPFCPKVSSCQLSVPREMADDSRLRHVEDLGEYTHWHSHVNTEIFIATHQALTHTLRESKTNNPTKWPCKTDHSAGCKLHVRTTCSLVEAVYHTDTFPFAVISKCKQVFTKLSFHSTDYQTEKVYMHHFWKAFISGCLI